MNITFITNTLKKNLTKWKLFSSQEMNLKVQQRFKELEASDNLLVVKELPQLRLHKLKGKRMYELAIDIRWKTNPNRIIFVCKNWEDITSDWPNPNKLREITDIEIVEIWDYH